MSGQANESPKERYFFAQMGLRIVAVTYSQHTKENFREACQWYVKTLGLTPLVRTEEFVFVV